MTATRHQKVKEIYSAGYHLSERERAKLLNEACGNDQLLRDELESLFKAGASAGEFMRQPIMDGAAILSELAQPPSEALAAPLPITIGRYRVIRAIGEGGMGRVYEAEQDKPRRRVAIKVIRQPLWSKRLAQRFAHEAEILARLRHPSIAQVYDAGVAEVRFAHGIESDVPFIAMELIDGCCLTDFARQKRLNDRQRLELLSQVCEAVHHGHQQGVIHRDLKPANILVEDSGIAKVIDFGVARATDSDIAMATLHTDAGQILGTLTYMSPEQVSGSPRQIDSRSDIYSLGVIGFELLTERHPYDLSGLLVPQAARRIQDSEPLRMSSISRVFRGDIETIISKAIEKEPPRRYQLASEFAADIRRFLANEPIVARPPSLRYQFGKFARRHKELVVGMALVMLTLVVGIVATTVAMLHAQSDRAIAQREAIRSQRANGVLQQILGYARPGMKGGGRDVRVVEMLDAASDGLSVQFQDVPELEFIARQTLGETYARLGLYSKAAADFERARNLAIGMWGSSSEQAMTLAADIALCRSNAFFQQHESVEFKATTHEELRELLDLLEQSRTMTSLAGRCTQKLLLATATLETRLWRLRDSEWRYRELLEMVQRAPPEQQIVSPIVVMGQLSRVLWLNRKYDEAVTLARLAAAEERAPENLLHLIDHPPSMTLAAIAIDNGHLEEAEAQYRQGLDLQVKILGEDHAWTVNTMFELAALLAQQEKWEGARIFWSKQRHFYETSSPELPWIAYLLWYEANMLAQQDRMLEARQMFEASISKFHNHPSGNDLSWVIRTRAIVQMGLQTGLSWAGEGLRQGTRSMLFDALYNDGSKSLALDQHHWERAEFAAYRWTGDMNVTIQQPVLAVTGVEALRAQPDPSPGVYLLQARVPRRSAPALEAQTWLLLADWNLHSQGAGRDAEPADWEKSVRIGPVENQRAPTLILRDWFEEGFGPNGRHISFEITAQTTVDLPSGTYRLITDTDDGIRVWVDEQKVIDHWAKGRTQQRAEIEFRGDPRSIRLEYFQHGQDARLWVRLEPLVAPSM